MNEQKKEYKIKAKAIGGFIRLASGVFITRTNPLGLTATECTILAAIVHCLNGDSNAMVSKETKEEVANMSNHSVQVITNYVNKLKKKGAITTAGRLHPILTSGKIVIEYGEGNV